MLFYLHVTTSNVLQTTLEFGSMKDHQLMKEFATISINKLKKLLDNMASMLETKLLQSRAQESIWQQS